MQCLAQNCLNDTTGRGLCEPSFRRLPGTLQRLLAGSKDTREALLAQAVALLRRYSTVDPFRSATPPYGATLHARRTSTP